MNRGIKISLNLATTTKLRRLEALRREVRGCRQAYINYLWDNGGQLDSETLNKINWPSLSARHRTNCLRVALDIISSTRKAAQATGRKASRPQPNQVISLSSLVAKIEKSKGSFDYVLKVSGLTKGKPIIIPFKSHARLNYWLSRPLAKILDGCILGQGWVGLWIKLPDLPIKTEGDILAIDLGINKLMVDSEGTRYGTEMKQIMARVRRCRPGSKGMLRARRTRTQYVNREVKRLPWGRIRVIGFEDLRGLKQGKKQNRSRAFRRMIAPWTYRQALARIEQLAQENRVLPVSYDPRNTSRECPCCGSVAKENRRGEVFECVKCHYSNDADVVGALNGLVRTRGNCG